MSFRGLFSVFIDFSSQEKLEQMDNKHKPESYQHRLKVER